ncbi:radical SAM protein [bacterium]|nr:radical SAM protein [bacterium]
MQNRAGIAARHLIGNEIASNGLSELISREIVLTAFPPATFMDLHVTDDCNLACPYCFIHGKKPRYLSKDTAKLAVDFLLRESRGTREISILFIGGEPLLNMPVMEFVVHYAKMRAKETGKTVGFSITTNGTLLNQNSLEFFIRNNIPFLLSIDGAKETQDTYRRYKDGRGTFDDLASLIEEMKKIKVWLGVRMTPTPSTVHRLHLDVKALFDIGVNQYIIGVATGIPWSNDDLSVYKDELLKVANWYVEKKLEGCALRISQFGDSPKYKLGALRYIWGCGAGRGRISVSTDGEIQGCAKIQGLNDLSGLINFGNVRSGWTNLAARYAFICTMIHLRRFCDKCDLQFDCAGGCPAVNWESTGSIYLSDAMQCKAAYIGTLAKAIAITGLKEKNGKAELPNVS